MGKRRYFEIQVEALVFTAVGAAIAFLLVASMTFAVCRCTKNKRRREREAAKQAKENAANGDPYRQVKRFPKVFYN